jgi:hypothetical protein
MRLGLQVRLTRQRETNANKNRILDNACFSSSGNVAQNGAASSQRPRIRPGCRRRYAMFWGDEPTPTELLMNRTY